MYIYIVYIYIHKLYEYSKYKDYGGIRIGFRLLSPIIKDQMQKNMESDMKIGAIW